MKIEIQGQDAISAAEELLRIEGLEGSYQTLEEVERTDYISIIATFLEIAGNTLTIAKAIYAWYQKSKGATASPRIEKVLIVGSNGRRLLLKDATVKQIQEILED